MKRILVFVLVIMICTLVGCSNTEEPPETTKESVVNEVETSGVKWSEEKFSFMDNEDIVWYTGEYPGWDADWEYGKVVYDSAYKILYEEMYDELKEDKLYAIRIYFAGGILGGEDVYERFISPLDLKSELVGFSEEELNHRFNSGAGDIGVLVFLNKKQIKDIVSSGCPDDMMICLSWAYKYNQASMFVNMAKKYELVGFDGFGSWWNADVIEGKITHDYSFVRIINGYEHTKDNQLLVIRLKEMTGKKYDEFYNRYVKGLNVITEFEDRSDEEIQELFRVWNLFKSYEDGQRVTPIIVFVTSEQLEQIMASDCPDDMAISLEWHDAGEINMLCGEQFVITVK